MNLYTTQGQKTSESSESFTTTPVIGCPFIIGYNLVDIVV